jgi:hypothetical protein
MANRTPVKRIPLRGMKESNENKPLPWETEWTLLGPIQQDAKVFLGKLTSQPLELDGAITIPNEATVAGRHVSATKARSTSGLLDFRKIFNYSEGFPMVYAMTVIEASAPGIFPLYFGADWVTLWWLNGNVVFETMSGNGVPPAMNSYSFPLHLKRGKNVLVIRIVSGLDGWLIHLGHSRKLVSGAK